VYEDMRLAGKCFKPKAIVNTTPIKDREIHNLPIPALFLVGENEKNFPPTKILSV
jgi:hypothetical protein